MQFSRHIFGDRWGFAVECEVQDGERDPWGSLEPFGSFWMWVGGRVVGNSDAIEQLIHAFTPLADLACNTGKRPDSRFKAMTNLDKRDLVIWARFGEDEEFDGKRWVGEDPERIRAEDLMKYEVVSRGNSPYSDGWEALLLEHETRETFIWRREVGEAVEVKEISLPLGVCGDVAQRACDWFDPFREQQIAPERADPNAKVRLVTLTNPVSRKTH